MRIIHLITSGDRYAGDPQKLKATNSYVGSFLLNPKSTSLICPLVSSIIFSGFKSLYIMFLECKYSIASITSHR